MSTDLLLHMVWRRPCRSALLWRVAAGRAAVAPRLVPRASQLRRRVLAAGARAALSVPGRGGLTRNHRELRYLVTPSNVVYSLARAAAEARSAAAPLSPSVPTPGSARRWTAAHEAGAVRHRGRRDRARRQLGPQRLRPPDHAGAGAAGGGQLHRRHVLRHEHGGIAALHVLAVRSARLRRRASQQRVAAARAATRAGLRCSGATTSPAARASATGLRARPARRRQRAGLCDGRALPRRGSAATGCDGASQARPGQPVSSCCTSSAATARLPPPLPRRLRALHARPATTASCASARATEIVNAYDNALLYTDHVLGRRSAGCSRSERASTPR